MGGYPNPRDCSKCICPRGYGGALCNARPQAKTCGETVTALSEKQTITHTLGDSKNGATLADFEQCYYWIQNPEKKTVKLTIKSLKVGYDNVACNYGGVEIKAQKDQLMSGYRFCDSEENKGKVITSSNTVIPVILYTRYGATKLELVYRTV
ncbi:unnamed protein product [Cylicostephanus goldi]|uniref:CUB domain-containing protein n=1 Tax=Cylicostephanus goldi TaxID=71465 RepID=A0A3P6RH83_CYLGO|nr:unnamed protein product [Cylicostephanus goldi]